MSPILQAQAIDSEPGYTSTSILGTSGASNLSQELSFHSGHVSVLPNGQSGGRLVYQTFGVFLVRDLLLSLEAAFDLTHSHHIHLIA